MFDQTALDYHPGKTGFALALEARLELSCSINTIYPVHAQDITDRALMSFKNNCVMPRFVDRQYDKLWGQAGAKRGTTINLRYPPQYELRRGDKAQPQGSQESFFPVTLGTPVGVDLDFTSQELLLTVDDFMNRFIKPAGLPIANAADADLCKLFKKVYNFAGTPGTPATSLDTYLQAIENLALAGAPVEGEEWSMVIDYRSNRSIITDLRGLFNPQRTISRQFDTARMGEAIGFKWSQDQNISIYTTGTGGSTPLVNGVPAANAASVVCDGAGGTVVNYLKEGDIVQFDAVNGIKVNTVELGGVGEDTGALMNFVCTAAVDSDGSGNFTIPIFPSLIPSGPFQNITALPADNAAVTVFGAVSTYRAKVTRNNLAFHRSAFVLGAVDLPLPGGMDMASRTTDEDTKLSMRFLRGFDIGENVFISRLDMLYVAACPRPQFACRVVG